MLFAIIAFLCFAGLVVAWMLLPATSSVTATELEEVELAGSELAA